MYPTLFEIGSVSISSFSVMVLIAFLVGYYITEKEIVRNGEEASLTDQMLIMAVVGGLGGAKILFLIQNATLSEVIADPMRYLASGYTFLGGLLGAILLIYLLSVIKKKSFWLLADCSAPGLILAYGIGRIGCLLVGDDYGVPTDLPWGMSFPQGAPPTLETVHPTQIYDTVLMVILFAFLWKIRTRSPAYGWMTSITLILLGTQRFLIEFIRETTPSFIQGLSQAQLLSLCLVIFGILKLTQISLDNDKFPKRG